mmetsp:Transcript_23097/g.66160  ORF Transcript_23097/g.66160 Transcript_23097/m.66160 type:complete len:853 (-) Transcript_23097:2223-4781(-)
MCGKQTTYRNIVNSHLGLTHGLSKKGKRRTREKKKRAGPHRPRKSVVARDSSDDDFDDSPVAKPGGLAGARRDPPPLLDAGDDADHELPAMPICPSTPRAPPVASRAAPHPRCDRTEVAVIGQGDTCDMASLTDEAVSIRGLQNWMHALAMLHRSHRLTPGTGRSPLLLRGGSDAADLHVLFRHPLLRVSDVVLQLRAIDVETGEWLAAPHGTAVSMVVRRDRKKLLPLQLSAVSEEVMTISPPTPPMKDQRGHHIPYQIVAVRAQPDGDTAAPEAVSRLIFFTDDGPPDSWPPISLAELSLPASSCPFTIGPRGLWQPTKSGLYPIATTLRLPDIVNTRDLPASLKRTVSPGQRCPGGFKIVGNVAVCDLDLGQVVWSIQGRLREASEMPMVDVLAVTHTNTDRWPGVRDVPLREMSDAHLLYSALTASFRHWPLAAPNFILDPEGRLFQPLPMECTRFDASSPDRAADRRAITVMVLNRPQDDGNGTHRHMSMTQQQLGSLNDLSESLKRLFSGLSIQLTLAAGSGRERLREVHSQVLEGSGLWTGRDAGRCLMTLWEATKDTPGDVEVLMQVAEQCRDLVIDGSDEGGVRRLWEKLHLHPDLPFQLGRRAASLRSVELVCPRGCPAWCQSVVFAIKNGRASAATMDLLVVKQRSDGDPAAGAEKPLACSPAVGTTTTTTTTTSIFPSLHQLTGGAQPHPPGNSSITTSRPAGGPLAPRALPVAVWSAPPRQRYVLAHPPRLLARGLPLLSGAFGAHNRVVANAVNGGFPRRSEEQINGRQPAASSGKMPAAEQKSPKRGAQDAQLPCCDEPRAKQQRADEGCHSASLLTQQDVPAHLLVTTSPWAKGGE